MKFDLGRAFAIDYVVVERRISSNKRTSPAALERVIAFGRSALAESTPLA